MDLNGVFNTTINLYGVYRTTLQGTEGDYTPMANEIDIFAGDYKDIVVTVNDSAGALVDISADKIWFTVKPDYAADDLETILQKKSVAAGGTAGEVTPVTGHVNQVTVSLLSTDTEDIDEGVYLCDVRVEHASKLCTVLRCKFTVRTPVGLV